MFDLKIFLISSIVLLLFIISVVGNIVILL